MFRYEVGMPFLHVCVRFVPRAEVDSVEFSMFRLAELVCREPQKKIGCEIPNRRFQMANLHTDIH